MSTESRDPIIPNYAAPGTPVASRADELVTLTKLPALEAELACNKLESEGIYAFAANAQTAMVNPLLGIAVAVQVRRPDLERAREILDRRPERAPDDEYVDEPWRCPTCRQKTLDLLPLTPAQRWRRDLWILTAVVTIVFATTPLARALDVPRAAENQLALWLTIILTVLGLWVLLTKRIKRCRQCGWTKST